MLLIARGMVTFFWRMQLDPDDHVIPLLSALGDVLGTGLLATVLCVCARARACLPCAPGVPTPRCRGGLCADRWAACARFRYIFE